MMTEFFQRRKMLMSSVMLPVGTVWIFDTVGSTQWDCPVAGNYQIEIHGGGGGGGAHMSYSWSSNAGGGGFGYYCNGGGGGGSGQLETRALPAGKYNITVGAGGTGGAFLSTMRVLERHGTDNGYATKPDKTQVPTDGSSSSISGNGISISVEGGKAGGQKYNAQAVGGDGSGNIAANGDGGGGGSGGSGFGGSSTSWKGTGKGGLGNTQKPDQTYGNGGDGSVDSSVPNYGNNGSDGAVIITYLGK